MIILYTEMSQILSRSTLIEKHIYSSLITLKLLCNTSQKADYVKYLTSAFKYRKSVWNLQISTNLVKVKIVKTNKSNTKRHQKRYRWSERRTNIYKMMQGLYYLSMISHFDFFLSSFIAACVP